MERRPNTTRKHTVVAVVAMVALISLAIGLLTCAESAPPAPRELVRTSVVIVNVGFRGEPIGRRSA